MVVGLVFFFVVVDVGVVWILVLFLWSVLTFEGDFDIGVVVFG